MQAIVVGTTPGSPFLADCLSSLSDYDKYPVIILCDLTWELGKLHFITEHTDISEAFFLPDSMMVKDTEIFDIAFSNRGSYALARGFGMYAGKYRVDILEQMDMPWPKNKAEAVQGEADFNWDYLRHDPDAIICPQPLEDTDIFVTKYGRRNMVLENDWVIKYKGTWSMEQLPKAV